MNFRFENNRHDVDDKTIFGQTGDFDWKDSCRLCLEHEAHAPYLVNRMWDQFVPVPPDGATQAALEELYLEQGYDIRPVVEAILMHPTFHAGPAMVKPPMVLIAGMLKARKRGVKEDSWYLDLRPGRAARVPPAQRLGLG